MRYKTLMSWVACMLLSATVVRAEGDGTLVMIDAEANAASAQALKRLAGQPLAGLPSASQLDKAALGDPLLVKMVRLDELQRFDPKSQVDPEKLLHDTSTVLYPIRVSGQVHGLMRLGKVQGTWSARGFAGPTRIRGIEHVRSVMARRAGIPLAATLLIQVPALSIEFVAFRNPTGLQLTPVTDLKDAGLLAGQVVSLAQAVKLLLPLAVSHNGLPG